jgi:hypothetical protein
MIPTLGETNQGKPVSRAVYMHSMRRESLPTRNESAFVSAQIAVASSFGAAAGRADHGRSKCIAKQSLS